MNDKPKYNPAIHHRRSIRLKGYDYSQSGLYFITLCVQDRVCLFGKIENGKIILNKYGEIAHNEWKKTMEIRKNVELLEFIVMPNHFHAIVRLLGRGELHSPDNTLGNKGVCDTPLQSPSQTIGAIVRGYKSSVTKQINTSLSEVNSFQQIWQRNYYEHIIRNEQSYQNISEYIVNNPAKWAEDKFHNS